MGTLEHSPQNRRHWYTLVVLLGINTLNFYDRQVFGAVAQPLKESWHLTDTQVGNLATAFTLLYALVGIPLGRWADFGSRKLILAAGVTGWSLLTAASGLAWSVASLFAIRLGVGIGEASCAPAATSLLGQLFPTERRGRATAMFMLGLPLGLSLSFIVSGQVALHWGWRSAFFVAGLPGLLFGLLALGLPEPGREAESQRQLDSAPGSLWEVLRTPGFAWIIVSGAIHNFNLYGLSTFLSPLLTRYHGLRVDQAGWLSGVAFGCFGGLGMLGGGWIGDLATRRRGGRLEVATLAMVLALPCLLLALRCAPGQMWAFAVCLSAAFVLLYAYYSAIYATIQDIIAPRLRGMAMAVYFCAMYLLGASVGAPAMGWLSDLCAYRAAAAAGVAQPTTVHVALGLHQAMYSLPILTALLALVLGIAAQRLNRRNDGFEASAS